MVESVGVASEVRERRLYRAGSERRETGAVTGNSCFPPSLFSVRAGWALRSLRSWRAAHASTSLSSALVLVVPADPELPILALFAAPGCMVEDRVVAHEELQTAPGRRVGLIHSAVVVDERAEAG